MDIVPINEISLIPFTKNSLCMPNITPVTNADGKPPKKAEKMIAIWRKSKITLLPNSIAMNIDKVPNIP